MVKQSLPLLRIRDLSIEGKSDAGWQRLVDGIDLEVSEGEVVGIVGESGAGKSTLGLAAMGYVRDGCRFAGGSVEYRGTDLISASRSLRRGLRSSEIAYVAQSAAASFNPFYRLIDQFSEFPVLRGLASRPDARRNAVRLYRLLQLPDPEHIGFRYPHQVSGGQLQRMMTAMAMACRPKLIVFDEPTTALDVTTQVEVLIAIRSAVTKLGTACIYITHDLAVVSQMADRVMVLRHGKVVEEQPTLSILRNPIAEYTKSLWAVRTFQAEPKQPASDTVGALCRIADLSTGYGDGKNVVEAVSFEVERGRTLAIVGESGSGKSTIARCLSGVLAPTGGMIYFEGKELGSSYRARSRETLRDIQIIFQASDMTLNPRQRISEIVGRPLKFYHGIGGEEQRRQITELLEQVELDPRFMDRFPGELSGGQRQRIGIARALAARPKLIICDEVISALDQLVAEGILRLLSRIQREQKVALIFITHDIDAVRAIADDVMIMKDGRIRALGPKDTILAPPFEGYTKELMDAVPEMDVEWLDRIEAGRRANGSEPAQPGTR